MVNRKLSSHKEHSKSCCRRRRDWFERQRNFFVRQFFADFFTLTYSFQKLYRAYCNCRGSGMGGSCYLLSQEDDNAHCRIWDQLNALLGTEMEKGPLWHLKELCHRVWPEDEHGENIEGSLIDWLMGSIFHETMRLREDVHILNSYGAAAVRNKTPIEANREKGAGRQNFPASRLSRIMDRKGLIKRVAVDVMQQMEQLAFLFGQTNNMLRTMLAGLSGNLLLVRFLVEQEDIVQDLWGEELVSVFHDMFFSAPEQGFCAAGRSYMSGQWYTRALVMYRRAMALNHECDEAKEKIIQLESLIRQNSKFLGAA
ncbi:MAG: hypothetical protein D3924_00120 [Candidatus Electrothrix sp. AR4]|nr:hypothetical protein [Candidatus Electrothrix sp. AR4]